MIKTPKFFSYGFMLFMLVGILIYQSWMLWQKVIIPPQTTQLNEKNLEIYPDIIFELSSSNPTKSWAQLQEEDFIKIDRWLSSDLITATMKKNNYGYVLTFVSPKGSKPSSIFQKLKFFPQLDILSIEVNTLNFKRNFILNLVER